jgi:hypothetical protein
MDKDAKELLDKLIADAFVGDAFRLQTLLTLASLSPTPETFVASFVSQLHERLDTHEASLRKKHPDLRQPIYEIGRHHIDRLGTAAPEILRVDREKM